MCHRERWEPISIGYNGTISGTLNCNELFEKQSGGQFKVQNGETIMLPTKNGLMRVDGRSVAFPSIEEYILLDTSQAASCMMLEPYMHFNNELGETYQYSSLSGDFEKADSHGRQVVWRVDALSDSTWMRVGRDTIINTYSVV